MSIAALPPVSSKWNQHRCSVMMKSVLYIYTMEFYDSAWIRNRIKKIQIQEDSNWLMYITLIYNYKYMYINICIYYVFIYVCVDTCMYTVHVDHDSRKRILRREDLLKCLFILFICVPLWKYVCTCVWCACARRLMWRTEMNTECSVLSLSAMFPWGGVSHWNWM